MAASTYRLLALKWRPSQKADTTFLVIAVVTVILMMGFGMILSSMDVPEKSRAVKAEVPERVAKFINKKPVPPKPPKPVVKPKPQPPKPKIEEPEKPKVERPKLKDEKKPLTQTQVKARDKVKDLGVLKHLSALNDMIDTPVSAQLKTEINKSETSQAAAGHDVSVLTSGAQKGSGGVDGGKYATSAGNSQLAAADLADARAALNAGDAAFVDTKSGSNSKARVRSEEEIILVIDRHKSQLQSLYNRARRTNPSLKGLLVLEITILPNGTVASVKVKRSELNDTALENSMIGRIKTLAFGAKDVDSVTVSYPIEFLPY